MHSAALRLNIGIVLYYIKFAAVADEIKFAAVVDEVKLAAVAVEIELAAVVDEMKLAAVIDDNGKYFLYNAQTVKSNSPELSQALAFILSQIQQ